MPLTRSHPQPPAPLCGVVVVDKPPGITSFGVVKAVRRALRVKKAGHTGTLDPMATGVLPVCVGEATRIAELILAAHKTYRGQALLGVQTDTLDAEGQVVARADPAAVTRERVEAELRAWVGERRQVPPAFSALRVDGQRAHRLARRGEAVDLPPRPITVLDAALERWDPPAFAFCVRCSKGTYIRALVRDWGQALGCGAHLTALRRTATGPFTEDQATPLADLEQRARAGDLPLLTMDQVLGHLPAEDITEEQARAVAQGQPLDPAAPEAPPPQGGPIRIRLRGQLIALGEHRDAKLWPRKVFSAARSLGTG